MGDPFLNYFALFLLIFVVVVLFYGIIAINDIPHTIAEQRHHPHQDAIYAAGWVSLFTLHALWPFLWIWAMAYRPDRGWGFASGAPAASPPVGAGEVEELRRRIAALEGRQPAGRKKPENARRDPHKPAEDSKAVETASAAGQGKGPDGNKPTGGE